MNTAEFDRFAEEYNGILRKSLGVTGEGPEFFHEYKIRALAQFARERGIQPESILDFGAGVGNSTKYFQIYFPKARLAGADISERSLQIAQSRFPGTLETLLIANDRVPAADASFDLAFSACAFHHIPHVEHVAWLRELGRLTRPDGTLTIFEHNPLNPLTVRAVNTCAFDENARLIRAKQLVSRFESAGWTDCKVRYHLFFPHALARLRPLERYLTGVPLGGQYSVTAIRSADR